MKKNGIYCPKCRRLIAVIPKQDRDFDEVRCPHDGCKGIWVNMAYEKSPCGRFVRIDGKWMTIGKAITKENQAKALKGGL